MTEGRAPRLARPTTWPDCHRLVLHVCRCRRQAGQQTADYEDVVQDALYLALRRYRRLERYGELATVPACMVARYAVGDAMSGRAFRLRGLLRRPKLLTGQEHRLDRVSQGEEKSMILRTVGKGGKT